LERREFLIGFLHEERGAGGRASVADEPAFDQRDIHASLGKRLSHASPRDAASDNYDVRVMRASQLRVRAPPMLRLVTQPDRGADTESHTVDSSLAVSLLAVKRETTEALS
jgi:hypothetical protein